MVKPDWSRLMQAGCVAWYMDSVYSSAGAFAPPSTIFVFGRPEELRHARRVPCSGAMLAAAVSWLDRLRDAALVLRSGPVQVQGNAERTPGRVAVSDRKRLKQPEQPGRLRLSGSNLQICWVPVRRGRSSNCCVLSMPHRI